MTTFDRWELTARSELYDRGIGFHEATPLIDDARAYHAESGQDPWAALGEPAAFAADVAAAFRDELSHLDVHGKSPRDYLSDAAFALAWFGVLGSVLGGITTGSLTIPVTVAGAAGTVLGALAVLTAALPGGARAAGRPRLAPWGFVLCGALVAGAGAGFTLLPRTRIGTLPVLLLLLVSLTAGWLLTRPARPSAKTRPGRESGEVRPGRPSGESHPGRSDAEAPGGGTEAPAGGADDPGEPEAWFARLESVLMGRFDVPPARAAELVAEARAHVAEASGNPSAEFPSLARYAYDLAESEPVRQGPWWRGSTAELLSAVVALLCLCYFVIDAVVRGEWWIVVLGTVASPLVVRIVVEHYRTWSAHR